jgi:phage-related holin
MSFNPDKCEVLRITNKRNKIMANYYIHGKQLQIVDNAKYLGLTISKNLSFG